MADVFISYHEKSAGELAGQIADRLDAAGISCWCARRDLPPGGDFADEIPAQIDACRVFLLIVDESVYESRHVENELGMAFKRPKDSIKILPFPTEKVIRKGWLRYYLCHIQSVKIPLSDPQRIEKLVQLIGRILGVSPRTTQPPPAPQPQPVQPPPAQPSANIIKSGKCGDNIIYTLDNEYVLTISGYRDMWDYKWDDEKNIITTPWYMESLLISDTNVCIQNGITSIGALAFACFERLTGITIPDSVTSIREGAFARCLSLQAVLIPESVTSIENFAFAECVSLKGVIILDSVIYIGEGAFEGCNNLKSVSVPAKAKIEERAFPETTEIIRRE